MKVTRDRILMTFWAIFDHPADRPDDWVVRRQYLVRNEDGKGSAVMVDLNATLHRSLDDARRSIPPGLYCQPHQPGDPINLHEIWF